MHSWGDDFDWQALNEACTFFSTNLKRFGRISVTGCKEKYGTMRLEFFYWGAHYNEFFQSLIHPGRLYITTPGWLRTIDFKIAAIAGRIGLSYIISAYQRLIFNIVTVLAVKKWPHIQREILDEYEFNELLYNFIKKKINYVCDWK